MRWVVFGLMAVVIATGIAHAGISIFECSPPAIFWTFEGNLRIFGEHCMTAATQQKFWDATGAIVVLTDLCLWLCPLPMVWSLQLPIVRDFLPLSCVQLLKLATTATENRSFCRICPWDSFRCRYVSSTPSSLLFSFILLTIQSCVHAFLLRTKAGIDERNLPAIRRITYLVLAGDLPRHLLWMHFCLQGLSQETFPIATRLFSFQDKIRSRKQRQEWECEDNGFIVPDAELIRPAHGTKNHDHGG